MITQARLALRHILLRPTFVVTSFLPMLLLLGTSIVLLATLFSAIPVYATENTQPAATLTVSPLPDSSITPTATTAPLDAAPQTHVTDTQVYTSELHHWSLIYPQEWSIDDADAAFVRFLAADGSTYRILCAVQHDDCDGCTRFRC